MKNITAINGNEYLGMISGGVKLLRTKEEIVNNLNVFPVPDGDTGSNMLNTASGALSVPPSESISEVAAMTATAMMRASRGNSGVILSLYFRGVAKALSNCYSADAPTLLSAFRQGAVSAASAVAEPVEGTVLTVMRECCVGLSDTDDIGMMLEEMIARAEEVLAKTPDMLPALKRARVVDSGGQGFIFILRGMEAALAGEEISDVLPERGEMSEKAYLEGDGEDIHYPFCTECLLDRSPGTRDSELEEFRAMLAEIGDSIVFVTDPEIVKLHVHTSDPLAVLTRAAEFGTIVKMKVENMRVQHTGFVEKTKAEEPAKHQQQAEITAPEREFGIAAVCSGSGIADAMREAGADAVISGGQSMNPSTDEIISAVRSCRARTVFVLPNNKNVILAAQQAAKLIQMPEIRVIKTVSIPEGIAAALAFNGSRSADENERVMTGAAKNVITLSFTRAIRNAQVDSFLIKKKQYIGLSGDKICAVGDGVVEVIEKLIRSTEPREFYTIYYGHGVKEENAAEIAALISSVIPDAEVFTVFGDQNIYPYIISAE